MANRKPNLQDMVFDVKDDPMPKGSWWWWFWLLFFDNPKNPKKPRQLMILWSTKNEKSIDCNGKVMLLGPQDDRSNMDGAVAAWYFDGEKMHHNFLLEQCKLKITGNSLASQSLTPTTFSMDGKKSVVTIGNGMKFTARMTEKCDFTKPDYRTNHYPLGMNYSLLRVNHLDLDVVLNGEKLKGSAYFQRVFVNSPSPGWYWGVLHFKKGGVLTYFNPRFMGKSVKQDIVLFDGKDTHRFKKINVRGIEAGPFPDFVINGENETHTIKFTVVSYEHSSWTFRKRAFGIFPNKLVYNEYPMTVSDLVLEDKKTGKKITSDDLGLAIGNAEHSTGLLL